MLKIQKLLLFLLFLPIYSFGQQTFTYDHNGVNRSYILYLPANIQADAPLVFVLHGYTSTADNIMGYCGMNDEADTHGFAVCYPYGLPDGNGFFTHWNANLTISQVDDIGFLPELAGYLQTEHSLNPEHTFSCGMSNGGFMSYTLACERPDVFKAIASVTGTMSGYDWQNCDPLEVVPVFQIVGSLDNVVPVDGSMSTFGGWGGGPGAILVNDYWMDLNECSTSEVITLSSNLDAEYYRNGTDGKEVWFYPINGMTHEWPGAATMATTGINAAVEIWEFFSLVIENTTTDVDVLLDKECLQLLPNPTAGVFEIRGLVGDYQIQVLDATGAVYNTLTTTDSGLSVDISMLPSGLYFISIVNNQNNNIRIEKILKM